MLATAQATLGRNLLTIRRVTSSNRLISGLGTNGDQTPRINSYDGCSCFSLDGCPKLSGLFEFPVWDTGGKYNSLSPNKTVPGLLFDCYPLDATLGSTLECYYQSSCLALIHAIFNTTPLSSTSSTQFSSNTTIQALFDELFIEEVEDQVSFAQYYLQCNPSSCTYIRSRRFDLLFMLSTVITVFGGLAAILKLIAPLIIKVIFALRQRCQRGVEQTVHADINYGKLSSVTS
ncbi:unnamed protein product [Adineta steineri]|uniref:Uncharacterized protein n=1 Tax=Adineta steineri TaxID=433720 RepID=A0A814J670_9BILA|nr:unnamed protein product [Adineta steineri]CAF1076899.1 unnamed protein product [Adineta steineri]